MTSVARANRSFTVPCGKQAGGALFGGRLNNLAWPDPANPQEGVKMDFFEGYPRWHGLAKLRRCEHSGTAAQKSDERSQHRVRRLSNAISRATQKPKRVILCPIRLEGERDSSGGKTRPDYSVEEDCHKCDLIAPTP
jgi:hypothetical protein